MRKLPFLFSIALVFLLAACGPTQNDAIKYNDSVVDIIDKLTKTQNLFMNQLDGHNVDSLKLTHKLFLDNTTTSLQDLSNVKPLKDKTDFGKNVAELFTMLNVAAKNEGKQLVELLSKDSTQYTVADEEKVKQLAEKFDVEYNKAYNKMEESQKKLSKEWGFDLIKDKR